MNNAIEAISIGFAVAMIFGIPFGFAAFMRYLKYKETIALAERGLLRESRKRRNRDSLRWGILISFVGFGLTIGLFLFATGPAVILGLVPAFFGMGLMTVYYLNKEEDKEESEQEDEVDPIPPHKVP